VLFGLFSLLINDQPLALNGLFVLVIQTHNLDFIMDTLSIPVVGCLPVYSVFRHLKRLVVLSKVNRTHILFKRFLYIVFIHDFVLTKVEPSPLVNLHA
jgi:hypothetical protein